MSRFFYINGGFGHDNPEHEKDIDK